MAKQQFQKSKIIEICDYLEKNTDEEHGVGINDIINHLAQCGIPSERKALYTDIDTLISRGMDIVSRREGKATRYFLASRTFETAEIKMLADIVSASRFVTAKKTEQLIDKLSTLCSVHDAKKIRRRIPTAEVKTANEIIYVNVDALHTAFYEEEAVTFKYFKYNYKKEKIYGHDGALYTVVPIMLVWNNENYYLVAYNRDAKEVRHYRVDKMNEVSLAGKITNEEKEICKNYDTSNYSSKSVFDMYKGKAERVELSVPDRFVDAMFDRFGSDITGRRAETDGRYIFNVEVQLSPLFYAWVSGFEGEIFPIAPEHVVNGYREHINKLLASLGGAK